VFGSTVLLTSHKLIELLLYWANRWDNSVYDSLKLSGIPFMSQWTELVLIGKELICFHQIIACLVYYTSDAISRNYCNFIYIREIHCIMSVQFYCRSELSALTTVFYFTVVVALSVTSKCNRPLKNVW
jgi:hypothetical protein